MMKTGFRKNTTSPNYTLLRSNAIKMRDNPTPAENLLWHVLRCNKFNVKFRRQHIIDDYIADFACISKGLIIEVDGEYHNSQEQKEEDALRSARLQSKGYRVMRFTNEQILNDIDHVITSIERELKN